jgi:hypothetical protein
MTETPCRACPLRQLALFLDHTAEELELVQSLRCRQCRFMSYDTGTRIA